MDLFRAHLYSALPGIAFALEQEKLPVDRKAIKDRAARFDTFDEAMRKCESLDIAPVFMGPSPFTDNSGGSRLNVGEDVSDFLNGRCASADESSDPDSDSDHDAPTTNDERSDERDDRLGQLCAEIEGYTLNTHVDILRASIARHQLRWNGSPISPGTGGSQRRKKFNILQEMRQAVGASILPGDARRRHTAPRRPDVPMGTPVDSVDHTPTATVSISTRRRSAA